VRDFSVNEAPVDKAKIHWLTVSTTLKSKDVVNADERLCYPNPLLNIASLPAAQAASRLRLAACHCWRCSDIVGKHKYNNRVLSSSAS